MTSRTTGPTHLQPNSIDSLAQYFSQRVSFSNSSEAIERIEAIKRAGLSSDLFLFLVERLGDLLGRTLDADATLERFARFVLAARSPQSLVVLLQRDPASMESLLQLLSASHWLSECLIEDPEAFDLIRMTGGQPIDREVLVDEIYAECQSATSVKAAQSILKRHRRRETLRIAFGDLVQRQPLELTCEQLTFLADAILGAAIETAGLLLDRRRVEQDKQQGHVNPGSHPSSMEFIAGATSESVKEQVSLACIASGAYGGKELDYVGDLEVLFVAQPQSDLISDQLAREWVDLVIELLSSGDHLGPTYPLTFRLMPRDEADMVIETNRLGRYFELSGRTWHRQEFIKARVAAGDESVGEAFLARLQPWIYRRYLGAADQEGIRGLKRKLYRWTTRSIDDDEDEQGQDASLQVQGERQDAANMLLKLSVASAEEIAFAVRFLQLLNGSDLPQIRVGNTLRAIEALEQAGCLTMQERSLLTEHYVAFRQLGHRLQLASNLLVDDASGQQQRSGVEDPQSVRTDLLRRRGVCRRIVDHLLGDVFTEAEDIPPETEMVLDPDFDSEAAIQILAGYGFAEPAAAFRQLLSLATESIRFLSDRRSRHFLAGIAPKLLEEIARTPNPDMTLERFAAVSDSLGGKAALFELFQTNPSTLRLCVRLCATSPYLTGILTSNPGMVDELIDSLLLDRLPSFEELEAGSRELCRFAEDIEPILHSLKNSAHLRIGVRDVLGRDGIQETHRAIADTAEVCLRRIAEDSWQFMIDRFGQPLDDAGRAVGLTMIALGKLGGRETNYHSDLDVLFVYDADGRTKPLAGGCRESTSNSHFFHELTQLICKRANQHGAWGRLFELDSRIRFSHDRGGAMAVTIEQFRQHFSDPACRLWQRLALVNARIFFRLKDPGSSAIDAEQQIDAMIQRALLYPAWAPELAVEAANLRTVLQRGAAEENIKRGAGGTMDVEAIVQMLLLRRAADLQGQLGVGTLEGLDLLRNGGWISIDRAQQLATGYRYLRSVESNLRLMNLPARHDLPQSADELRPLAFAMRETHLSVVTQKCDAYREINRQLFECIFAEEAGHAVEVQR